MIRDLARHGFSADFGGCGACAGGCFGCLVGGFFVVVLVCFLGPPVAKRIIAGLKTNDIITTEKLETALYSVSDA